MKSRNIFARTATAALVATSLLFANTGCSIIKSLSPKVENIQASQPQTKLSAIQIPLPEGFTLKARKISDNLKNNFGEAYFSNLNEIKLDTIPSHILKGAKIHFKDYLSKAGGNPKALLVLNYLYMAVLQNLGVNCTSVFISQDNGEHLLPMVYVQADRDYYTGFTISGREVGKISAIEKEKAKESEGYEILDKSKWPLLIYLELQD